MRIRGVETGHTFDRRLQMIEAALCHQGGKFRAKARCPGRLVNNQAFARFLHRFLDRFDVERHQRAQIENVRVDAFFPANRFGNMNHGAICEDGHFLAPRHMAGLAQRDLVVAFGDNAFIEPFPRFHRLVVIAAEGPVIDAFGFEEDDRVIVLDAGNQQALRIVGCRRDNRFQAGDMGEDCLGALAVGLPAEDTAAEGRTHRHRRDVISGGTVTQPCCL